MKAQTFFAILTILGLLVSCAQLKPHSMDMTQAVQNARSSDDQKALAKHYEGEAREMQKKVQEHKILLEQYEYSSNHYGKRAQDLQAHCRALIRYFEQAAKANTSMAEIHRQMISAPK
jgi:hypothetical protein